MRKKIIAIIAITIGVLLILSGVAPIIIGEILKIYDSASVGIIGGADGPTAVFVTGVTGTGDVIIELLVGLLLLVGGILVYRRIKK